MGIRSEFDRYMRIHAVFSCLINTAIKEQQFRIFHAAEHTSRSRNRLDNWCDNWSSFYVPRGLFKFRESNEGFDKHMAACSVRFIILINLLSLNVIDT